ncbi:MAG: TonB-dependent receptor [Methylococcaceae bacterium]|nr:TonB-dependent receptor [Methylococcaceae bacterium]
MTSPNKTFSLQTQPLAYLFSVAIGEARSRGVELDLSGRVTDNLSLIGTYAYTDARITRDNPDSTTLQSNQGHRLPNTPEHSGSLWAKWSFSQESLLGWNVGVGIYLAGNRQGDNLNSYQMPGYARLDAMTGYSWSVGGGRLTAQVNINNLLDKQYYAASRFRREATITPGDPLTVLGSIRLEY